MMLCDGCIIYYLSPPLLSTTIMVDHDHDDDDDESVCDGAVSLSLR